MSLSHSGYLLYVSIESYSTGLTANSSSATMNEGPQGDCFLSAHLLPEPDEGGNYRWPTCTIPYAALYSKTQY